jgi:ferredoxin
VTPRTKLAIDVVLLVGAAIAFASGVVLLFAFHMGFGCFRPEALGLSRLTWQNLHRLGAILALPALLTHVVVNRRPLYRRCLRVLRGSPMRHDVHELAVYATMTTILLTGFVAWLVVDGSMPILGPALLAPVARARHPWIDVHDLVALVALVLAINHVRRRWPALSVLLARARGQATKPARAWPWRRPHGTAFIALDTRRCQACADCVRACSTGALGMVAFLWHRHARVDHADACTGCGRCLRACKQGAITPTACRPPRSSANVPPVPMSGLATSAERPGAT